MATNQPAQAKAVVQCHHPANLPITNTNYKDKDMATNQATNQPAKAAVQCHHQATQANLPNTNTKTNNKDKWLPTS